MTNKTVTESIFSSGGYVIPMAEVQHIEPRPNFGLSVVFKSTTYNSEAGEYNNSLYLSKELADAFVPAWCHYRAELEADTLMELSPQPAPTQAPPAKPAWPKEEQPDGTINEVDPLDMLIAPVAPTQAPPAPWVMLTEGEINEVAEPFGYFKYGDAQGEKREEFSRAIQAAFIAKQGAK